MVAAPLKPPSLGLMKLQKNTIALLFLALCLGIYTLATQRPPRPLGTEPAAEAPAKAIFTIAEAELAALTIARDDETLRLVKSSQEGAINGDAEQPTWLMAAPEEGPASTAAVAFLVDLLLVEPEAGLRSFQVERALLAEYGLAEPAATLSLELQDGTQRQLALGNPSFEGRSLYARLDPERNPQTERVEVLLVNADLQSAIERPVEEWLQADEPS